MKRCLKMSHFLAVSQFAEKLSSFVGRAFRHDIKSALSSGVLTPEGLKTHFPPACSAAMLVAILASPVASIGQTAAPKSKPAKAVEAAQTPAHDLSGMYEFFARGVQGQGIYNTPSANPVPMTPWAQAKYDAAKPGYGPKASVDTTDPILRCNPSGIPRILYWPQPFEIVQTPERVFMFFEHERVWRQIWTDGRRHPKDLEPTWMGDSIGKWEGDTLVVDTIGLNDKSWLDAYGHPHSEELHLVERYRRPDPNTLTLQFTVDDPKAYTTRWESDTKIYTLLRNKQAVMEELFCIQEEEDAFTKRIREPAAGRPIN